MRLIVYRSHRPWFLTGGLTHLLYFPNAIETIATFFAFLKYSESLVPVIITTFRLSRITFRFEIVCDSVSINGKRDFQLHRRHYTRGEKRGNHARALHTARGGRRCWHDTVE